MSEIVDDKSEHVIPFLLERLRLHRERHHYGAAPFFIGLNGVQGAGKTTLVTALHQTLTLPPYSLPTAILSIDDLYLTHEDQLDLAGSHPDNPLVQHRGEPGTHDLALGVELFNALKIRHPTKIPVYDKSAFNGQGDRADDSTWPFVNDEDEERIEVVVFEGWCVGFRALSDDELKVKWENAVEQAKSDDYVGQLGKLKFEDVQFVNEQLKGYDALTDCLDAFVHIDAEDTQYVYQWRLQQEAALRESRGTGMTDEQVIEFVSGYYPAYELYTDTLRRGIFTGQEGKQLRLLVGSDRKVTSVHTI